MRSLHSSCPTLPTRARPFAASSMHRRTVAVRSEASADRQPATQQPEQYRLEGGEPQRFTVSEGQLGVIGSAAFSGLVRLGSGGFCTGYKSSLVEDDGRYAVTSIGGRKVRETSMVSTFPRPAKPLVLFEFEGCPFCRKVREAVSILDLDVLYYPCPKGGPTWRPEAVAKGGKAQFPLLVDENTGVTMYESDDIIRYLYKTYGPGEDAVPLGLRMGYLTTLTCGLGLAPRAGAGSRYSPSQLPEKPLVYWGYELSPFCKVVREVLCELEIPHLQRSCARGSPKRQELYERWGHFQVPYIEDPNTGVAMFESKAIIEYLRNTYGKPQ